MGIFTDLTGRKFAYVTVTGQAEKNRHGQITWRTLCECGAERFPSTGDLTSGKIKSCGCKKAQLCRSERVVDLTGMVFGRLTVVSLASIKARKYHWNCVCRCGSLCISAGGHLKSGAITSCGCLKKEMLSAARSLDIAGQKFGKLRAISFDKSIRGSRYWLCRCDCGNTKSVSANRLSQGRCISCGCAPVGANVTPLTSSKSRNQAAADGHRRRARKREAGGTFTAAQIDALLVKQRGRCANCGVKLTGKNLARDHRHALARGGDNDILNMELLCRPCNGRKSSKDEIVWANENGRLL